MVGLREAFVAAVLLRALVGLHSYSGARTPKGGDYEAQRHWMEVTSQVPLSDWYWGNSTHNALEHWGLDYPPLTAYHSWALGRAGLLAAPPSFQLGSSRNHEGQSGKAFMRWSVIVSDVLVLIPACLLALPGESLATRLLLCCAPPVLLVDHGHFQFNGVCLGLALSAVASLARGRELLASALFVLALSFKHMALHLAPAFFFLLLGRHYSRPARVLLIGAVVLGTFGLVWAPFLRPSQIFQVVHRLFPIQRGLFEDKVANFWCSVSPLLKLKARYEAATLFRLSLVATLVALTPSSFMVFLRPTQEQFVFSLCGSALAFFLFSFQVHEKTILISLMPILLLHGRAPHFVRWFCVWASFSMYPLLTRDGLALPYLGLQTLLILYDARLSWLSGASLLLMLMLHAVFAFVAPPPALPHLWELAITSSSFVFFAASTAYLLWLQFSDFYYRPPN